MGATGGAAGADGVGIGPSGVDASNGGGAAAAPRCVLWHPPGTTLPGELLRSLCKRNVRITVCTDAFHVMAHACRGAGREAPSREAGVESETEALVVLLVRPRELPRATDLIGAIGKYAPRAACWQYDERLHPALQSVTPEDVRSWAAPAARATGPSDRGSAGTARAKAEHPPRLRLAGEGRPGDRLTSGDGSDPRTLLTEEELSMLLDPGEPAAPRGSGGRV